MFCCTSDRWTWDSMLLLITVYWRFFNFLVKGRVWCTWLRFRTYSHLENRSFHNHEQKVNFVTKLKYLQWQVSFFFFWHFQTCQRDGTSFHLRVFWWWVWFLRIWSQQWAGWIEWSMSFGNINLFWTVLAWGSIKWEFFTWPKTDNC